MPKWFKNIISRINLSRQNFASWYRDKPLRGLMLVIISFILPLFVSVVVIIMPVFSDPFAEQVSSDENAEILNESVPDAKMISLEQDLLFWQNRVKASKSDSISMVVDLRDSSLYLELKGVIIRSSKFFSFNINRSLEQLRKRTESVNWLTSGFTLQDHWATLPKSPIKVQQAPEDTIEAQEMLSAEPPVENQDVHFTLQFDHNLFLQIHQEETPTVWGWVKKLLKNWKDRANAVASVCSQLYGLNIPQDTYSIELEISKSDAKAIYRALPANAFLILRL